MARIKKKVASKAGRRYTAKVSKVNLEKAKNDVENKRLSVRDAAKKWNLSKSTLHDYIKGIHTKSVGRQTIFSDEEETLLCDRIVTLANWGFPLDIMDLRMLVKGYLEKRGITVSRFKDNTPGHEWGLSFLNRHKSVLSRRVSQNIKADRAKVTASVLKKFYENLKVTLDGVPPENIINYDETNLTDDPGKKKIIVRRGTKYPERVMNSTKSSISVMFAGTASGHLLPPYVVYKAVHLYDTWTEGGPPGTKFNRSLSGWFEACSFDDWFHNIILPYAREKEDKIVLIGDNLSSHISPAVIETCEKNNISFTLLPPNSTHLTQPLDIALFRPLKIHWRSVLENFKKTTVGRLRNALPKDCFPALLSEMMDKIKGSAKDNLRNGFRKSGIYPLDANQAISRLPEEPAKTDFEASKHALDSSVIDYLKEMRHGTEDTTLSKPRKKKRLNVEPGRSITTKSLREMNEATDDDENELDEDTTTAELPRRTSGKVKPKPVKRETSKKNYRERGHQPTTEMIQQPSTSSQEQNVTYTGEIEPSDWVIVRVPFDKKTGKELRYRYFIAVIEEIISDSEINVRFLKHVKGTCHTFVNPERDDYGEVSKEDIIKVLPEPTFDTKCRMVFDVDVNLWPK